MGINKQKIIGIDLGTSNSAAAVYDGIKSTVVPSAEGASLYGKAFPSYVAFAEDGQILVGEAARMQAITNPDNTVFAVKRKMGTNQRIEVNGKLYLPQEISAYILQKIKKDAEAFIGEPVKKAVITVPAYFDDNQRTATKEAGKIAGLDVVRIINEPTAAGLAYGINTQEYDNVTVMVYDLGGGTLDVTIMEIADGVYDVKSTCGDTNLGGTDMDDAIIDYVVSEFEKEHGINLKEDPHALQRIREASEKAKIQLSNLFTTDISLPFITMGSDGNPLTLNVTLTRAKLESLVDSIVDKSSGPIQQALDDAGLTKSDIDKIILVGGPTRMPIVQEFVENYMGKPLEGGVDPMECVSIGAAIQGAVLTGEITEVTLLDVTPLSLGVETVGGVATKLIKKNTSIPTDYSQIFSTVYDNQDSVNINVIQGERAMADDNTSLGDFQLTGIKPAPRGVPKIEVTFKIDSNGILNVSAKDLGTGKKQSIEVSGSSKLSESEIERLVNEAKANESRDNARRAEVEVKNKADAVIYAAEKALKGGSYKIGDLEKERIINLIKSLQKELNGSNINAIKKATDSLNLTLNEIMGD